MTRALIKVFLYRYFLICGLVAHVALLIGVAALPVLEGSAASWSIVRSLYEHAHARYPAVAVGLTQSLHDVGLIGRYRSPGSIELPSFPGPDAWPRQGVTSNGFLEQGYGAAGEPVQSLPREMPAELPSATTRVTTVDALTSALRSAKAGDVIEILPGTYRVSGRGIALGAGGTPDRPIHLRARRIGDVTLEFETLEGFLVDQPYWVFENLTIQGVCQNDDHCEHAFHVVGGAVGTTIRNNRLLDFNAALKVNGLEVASRSLYPDLGLVQNNTIVNSHARQTANPVTPLNIDAANGWVVSANFIADFSKAQGNRVSYGAFMKSNSQGGVFERNLVVCQWQIPSAGDVRIGLSFGGGGTGASFCRQQSCETEHRQGIIRNNIIARCPSDVGIYLNRAAETQIYRNLLVANWGIDVRFPSSSAVIFDNLIEGSIRDRDGGFHVDSNNLMTSSCGLFARIMGRCGPGYWYQDAVAGDLRLRHGEQIRGAARLDGAKAEVDFCGHARGAGSVLGPIDYGQANGCLPVLGAVPE